MVFNRIFGGLVSSKARRQPSGAANARAYVVGDVHGCLEELNQLLAMVETDLSRHPVEKAFLVFVGDLIDRGPDSAGVIERLRTYRHPRVRTVFLAGNHEEYFLRVLAGEEGVLDAWLRYGGRECAQSYGVDTERLYLMPEGEAAAYLRQRVSQAHRDFLESMGDTFRFGDYLIVHAGIRPGVPLDEQSRSDLRWIREPFLHDKGEHGFVVIHGHTIVDEVEERPNRIGIDTGAYRTGVLTALVLEDAERRVLATSRMRVAA